MIKNQSRRRFRLILLITAAILFAETTPSWGKLYEEDFRDYWAGDWSNGYCEVEWCPTPEKAFLNVRLGLDTHRAHRCAADIDGLNGPDINDLSGSSRCC